MTTDSTEAKYRYFIDLHWFEQNGRSFATLARSRLCSSKHSQHSTVEASPKLLATLKDCCSKREGFFSPDLPLRELIFRLLLSTGNEPLELGQIAEKLKDWLLQAGDIRDASLSRLKRIIGSDQYYGLRIFPEEPKES